MFRIVVCDDELLYLERLQTFLLRYAKKNGLDFELLPFTSADQLLVRYPDNVDLLFLDIAMPGVDGMAAAKEIRKYDTSVCIIFITTMYQYAIEGYAVRAFGFIKKPIREAELQHELTCALSAIEDKRAKEHVISIRCAGELHRIPISHISYCEVRNHQILVHTDSDVYQTRMSITEFEEKLAPLGFFRCHSSFLVNGDYIKRIGVTELELRDGSLVPISQRRRKDFLSEISEYLGGKI
ncbi:MAG: LytTR family DNA-binding domain-containing protein [Clostridiales bacterium]|nr:LytTR family DNA-binding domain-containing protein [Clostridiales bacterium]